jgi:hypothetical protein
MLIFDLIAEQRIGEAIERGEFADLPGAGQPLDLDDDPLVPEDLRLAYRILKNAGYLPPELEVKREIRALEDLIDTVGADAELATQASRKLQVLRMRLVESGRRGGMLQIRSEYFERLVRRLG